MSLGSVRLQTWRQAKILKQPTEGLLSIQLLTRTEPNLSRASISGFVCWLTFGGLLAIRGSFRPLRIRSPHQCRCSRHEPVHYYCGCKRATASPTEACGAVEPGWPWSFFDQGIDEEVPAVFDSEFPENVGDMEFCRALAYVQLVRNFLVCEVPEKQLEHLTFPCCQ